MIQTIFYREWIKTHWYLLPATLLMAGITGYSVLRIGRTIAIRGIDHSWVATAQKDVMFIDLLWFVPLLVDILLAIIQLFPEVQHRYSKLTLYLPYSQKKMIMSMLTYGVLAPVTCLTMSLTIMGIYLPQYFISELVQYILLPATLWLLTGFAGYLLVLWICLEPTWKRGVLNLITAALIFRVYFLAPGAEAHNSFLLWLILYTLLIASPSRISVIRFGASKQNQLNVYYQKIKQA